MSIRRRIFAVFAVVTVAAVLGLFNWLRSDLLPRYMEAQEDLLVDMAWLLAAQIEMDALRPGPDGPRIDPNRLAALFSRVQNRRFEARIYSLLKTRVDMRVYVTDAQGIVLFDSDGHRDLGRDNSQWRDVARTLEGAYGARSTRGDPLFPEGSTMYIGAPILVDSELLGVVSVGKTTRNVERFLDDAIRRMGWASLSILAAALLLALGLYRWVSRPLQQLHDYAEDLSAGRRVGPPALGDNEIGRVGEAMARLRRALDGKAYVEDYVQALTHELKSPTAAIAGAAELLGEDLAEADRRRFLANIRNEAARLQALIERMLELAEIENRDALDCPQVLDPAALLEEALDSLAPQLERRGIRLIRALPVGRIQVQGDALLLHRALVNLLDNAINHSPAGATLEVSLQTAPGQARCSICDRGPGIPDYARDRVFERFYCLPRPDAGKGTGLGLSFVQQIAQLHGGSIRLDPREGGGTCAVLSLPLA